MELCQLLRVLLCGLHAAAGCAGEVEQLIVDRAVILRVRGIIRVKLLRRNFDALAVEILVEFRGVENREVLHIDIFGHARAVVLREIVGLG